VHDVLAHHDVNDVLALVTYDLLAPVYHWFTEGFGTADLKEAKAPLDELSRNRRRQPIALPLDGDDLRMVDPAIDERRRGGGVREDAGPLTKRQIRREDETAAFVAAADDLEEEVGGPGDERGERLIRSF